MWQPSGRSAATFEAGPWQMETESRSPAFDSSKRARRQSTNSGSQSPAQKPVTPAHRRTKEQSQVWRNVQVDFSTSPHRAGQVTDDSAKFPLFLCFPCIFSCIFSLVSLYSPSRLSYEALRAVCVRIRYSLFSKVLNKAFARRQSIASFICNCHWSSLPVVHISSLFRSCPPRPFGQSAVLDRSPMIHLLSGCWAVLLHPLSRFSF